MAAATTSSVSADEQLQELQGQSTQAQLDLAYRVRAIEQSGGAPALYSQAIDADKLTDVTSNVAALDAVLSSDVVHVDDSATAAEQMSVVENRLGHLADTKTQLATRAQSLARRSHRLVAQQRTLLADANADVRRLAARIERQQEREADALGTSSTWRGPIPQGPTPYASAAIAAALSKLGSPYVWGAEGPNTFDCSGLVQWSYAQAGLVLPRLASDQYFASTPVPVDQMAPGDVLVYAYDTSDAATIHHITMYIGNGMMVEAPHTGDVVHVVPVYRDGLYGVARPGL
jgi:cell wall-associated NlpC family hydrolase